jgi:chaperone required for assembly of F1-ATPase
MTGGRKLRRFWKEVTVETTDGGFTVALDGKPIRTPGKAVLAVPNRALAEMVAQEWRQQASELRPQTMFATRYVNSAIDMMATRRTAAISDLAAFGETDLVCYRAATPLDLRRRQETAWDPLLAWAESRYAAGLRTADGVMPVVQPSLAVQRLAAEVARQDEFQLTAFQDIVVLTGSLVIALAVTEGVCTPGDAWTASRIDEDWQAEQWGEDQDALRAAEEKRKSFVEAVRFHAVCRPGPNVLKSRT